MPPTPPTARMGELHEIHLAEINGGRKSTSSGNQWDDPNDGRNHHDDPFAFSWDGKSTKGKSISVTLEMLAKIREQAGPERPELGLRWYGDEMLSTVLEDWIAVPDVDFEEMKIAATAYEAARPRIDAALADLDELRAANAHLEIRLADALETVRAMREEAAKGTPDQGRVIPGHVPHLPWVTVHMAVDDDDPVRKAVLAGVRYQDDGAQLPFEVDAVRVERTAGNRPRLFVNERLVRNGDLYRQGVLVARVWADKPGQEVG